MTISFDEALPRLTIAYHDGVLVPFIGSGMSLRKCVTWKEMLAKLTDQLGPRPDHGDPDPYLQADLLVANIEPQPVEDRATVVRKAIYGCQPTGKNAPQSDALAKTYWPLVISTNYDDVYRRSVVNGSKPEVLGRSRADCHRVLASLDACLDPVLWAIQGYVGGPCGFDDCVPEERRRELVDDLVLGHAQYQRAIHDSAHFRRAFAEVYRRRSLSLRARSAPALRLCQAGRDDQRHNRLP